MERAGGVEDAEGGQGGERRLRSWRHPAVLAAAAMATAAGFGQFGVVALLSDLAAEFGAIEPGDGIAGEVGMAGTTLGIGLAVIRLASIFSLPAAGIADRFGRRRILLATCAVGLLLTVAAAGAPTWWWFVAIFALGRPLLTGTTAIAGVMCAELTSSVDRAKAMALVGAAFAAGTGLFAVVRAVLDDHVGFRGILLAVAVPILVLPVVARRLEEPARFRSVAERQRRSPRRRLLGPVRPDLIPRLAVLCAIHVGVGLLTGPVNTYVFLFGEQIADLSPTVMSVLFLGSGATGLIGLLVGRWSADRLGRRITAGTAIAAGAGFGIVAYAGHAPSLVVGYPLFVLAWAAYAPAASALDTEVFPTSMRSTAAGWLAASQIVGAVGGLAAFAVLADALGGFGPAAIAISVPVALLAGLYKVLPETRGMELEDSAPERDEA